MPLDYSKTKKSFSNNVKREMQAGKPQKQAVAIAYSVNRRGRPKSKDMAGRSYSKGGY